MYAHAYNYCTRFTITVAKGVACHGTVLLELQPYFLYIHTIALINVIPHSLLGYRGDLTNLGVNGSCIGTKYLVKSTLCYQLQIEAPHAPPIYMGFDHCHFARLYLLHMTQQESL